MVRVSPQWGRLLGGDQRPGLSGELPTHPSLSFPVHKARRSIPPQVSRGICGNVTHHSSLLDGEQRVGPGKGSPASGPEDSGSWVSRVASREVEARPADPERGAAGGARAGEPLAQFPGSPALPQDSCTGCARTSGPGVGGGVLEARGVPAVLTARASRLCSFSQLDGTKTFT